MTVQTPNQTLLLLGSNVEPQKNIAEAIAALHALPQCRVTAVSKTYVTAAVGPDGAPMEQPDFHNVGVRMTTDFSIPELRSRLRALEAAQGRIRTDDKFAARPIDIDIVYFDSCALQIDGTHIPDSDAIRRLHVAVPLADVAPDWRHPQFGLTLRQIADRLAQQQLEAV